MNSPLARLPLFAACAMGATGALVFLALPLLIGLFIEELGFSEQQAGLVASSYFATYFVASCSSFLWIRNIDFRFGSGAAYLCMAAGLATAISTITPITLSLAMAVAGAGGGVLFSIAVHIIAQSTKSDRDFGWLLAAQQLVAAGFLFTTAGWTLHSTLFCMAILSAFLLPTAFGLSAGRGLADREKTSQQTGRSRRVLLSLAALAVNFMALSALWAFVERIGSSAGLSGEDISWALSISMLGGLAGALLVTRIGERWGQQWPLWMSAVTFLLTCLGYSGSPDILWFAAVTATFSFAWNFSLAYQMGVVAALDHSGKYSALIPAAQGIGAMLGPGLGGWLAVGGSYTQLLSVVALIMFLTFCTFSFLARRPVTARP